ncbi:MAG: hypothetical protein ACTSRK_00980 [Promethearchaeota archaeon]
MSIQSAMIMLTKKLIQGKNIFVFSLLLSLIIGMAAQGDQQGFDSTDFATSALIPNSQNTIEDPIIIENSSDWINYPFITGTGTIEDPYVITDVDIIGPNASEAAWQFEDGPETYGIMISDGDAVVEILNCHIRYFHVGIAFCAMTEELNIIRDNHIEDCGLGIDIIFGTLKIEHNIIENCRTSNDNKIRYVLEGYGMLARTFGGAGIAFDFAYDIEITSNIITSCDIGIAMGNQGILKHNRLENCGVWFDQTRIYHTVCENNTVNDLPLGVFMGDIEDSGESLVIDGHEQQYGQLFVGAMENVTLRNLEFRDTTFGCQVMRCHNLTLEGFIATNCLMGLQLDHLGPFISGMAENLTMIDLEFEKCLVGFAPSIIGTSVPETEFNANITIIACSENTYDLIFTFGRVLGLEFTVPVGTKLYFGPIFPQNITVEYEGEIYSGIEEVSSPYPYDLDPSLNPMVATLENIGNYSVFSEVLLGLLNEQERWEDWLNFTVVVKEFPKNTFNIPGYSGIGFVIGFGVGILSLVSVFTVRRRFLAQPEVF